MAVDLQIMVYGHVMSAQAQEQARAHQSVLGQLQGRQQEQHQDQGYLRAQESVYQPAQALLHSLALAREQALEQAQELAVARALEQAQEQALEGVTGDMPMMRIRLPMIGD